MCGKAVSNRLEFRQRMGISTSAQTQVPLYEELNSEDASQGLNHFVKKASLCFHAAISGQNEYDELNG